jgi:hypothetical protein
VHSALPLQPFVGDPPELRRHLPHLLPDLRRVSVVPAGAGALSQARFQLRPGCTTSIRPALPDGLQRLWPVPGDRGG